MAKKKTPKRLTKRERKALYGKGPSGASQHIHCVACGAHLDSHQFNDTPATARWIRCEHGSTFASCEDCVPEARKRLEEHDRSGRPVQVAPAWHNHA